MADVIKMHILVYMFLYIFRETIIPSKNIISDGILEFIQNLNPPPLVLFKSSCCRPELVELQVHMHLCVRFMWEMQLFKPLI